MADSMDNSLSANAGSLLESTKTNAAAAFGSVTNGPVAQNVKDESAKTSAELSNLASSRKTPSQRAVTGQPLTHYHSFFSELLSWNNPRASALAYVSIVSFILAARYLDVIRWALKMSWMALAVTSSAEAAGKVVLNHGIASQMRPRRYYTVSRATLDKMIGDVNELVNFFIIEAQRILFAENIGASVAAFVAAFVLYHLAKLVPYWGLAIMATTVTFFVPLVYKSNQEVIDSQIKNASEMIGAQTAQFRNVAQKQANHLTTVSKQYAGDYTGKVQEMLRGRGATPTAASTKPSLPDVQPEFPSPPEEEPQKPSLHMSQSEVLAAPEAEGEPLDKAAVVEKEPLLAS
ncbi:hypothetical protein CDD81_1171 [Ophiocordyceps australis]|uniref:Reticulon-like protein n=1 Tax=Ophiocordyceps australis TaxID=1399860 RepID=A0A2C5Y1E1_9HYPO|nr:hypothetical protein CDD81_1171 [Ophiocordyceps australis]